MAASVFSRSGTGYCISMPMDRTVCSTASRRARSGCDGNGNFLQMTVHGGGIASGQHQGRTDILGRAQIAPKI